MYQMVNVSDKKATFRKALAMGEIFVGKAAFDLIKQRQLPKGDALVLAEIAGIMGAKKASEMIPLCHPMSLDHVDVKTELHEDAGMIRVYCTAATTAKTGVEMEALAGVNAALLAIYDLSKMVEPALTISNVRLLIKEGGKSGRWLHPEGLPDSLAHLKHPPQSKQVLAGVRVATLTISDRAYAKKYADESGLLLNEALKNLGAEICDYTILPDDKTLLTAHLQKLTAANAPQLIVSTGGTGLSPRDVTPEVLEAVCERIISGFGEVLRSESARLYTPFSWLSRCMAGSIKNTLIIALPGRPKAVREGVAILHELLPHAFTMLNEGNHDSV